MVKYWIGVASEDHVKLGVEGGFSQLCHGKEAPLKRMKADDWIIYYSPKQSLKGKDLCRSFTAIGKVKDQRIYNFEMAPNFIPFRRDVAFYKEAISVPIANVLDELEWIEDKRYYGYKFRFGHFEISKHDFQVIAEKLQLPMSEWQ